MLGTYNGQISICNSDANEGTYNFAIKAMVTAPEIDVQGNGISIVDGDTTPSVTDDTNWGNVLINTTVSHTFTVRNTGTAILYLGTPYVPAGFSISTSDPLVTNLAPGASDTFTVNFFSSIPATYNGQISIASNDSDEHPYNFNIRAKSIAPEIDVLGNGVSIVDGDTTPSITDFTDFGVIPVGTAAMRTFTVINTGTAWLYIGTPSIPIGFTRGADHLVSSLAPGDSDTFSVYFTPSAGGKVAGEISIPNSDVNESPYNFTITAQGGVQISVHGLSFSEGENGAVLVTTSEISTDVITGEYSLVNGTSEDGDVSPTIGTVQIIPGDGVNGTGLGVIVCTQRKT